MAGPDTGHGDVGVAYLGLVRGENGNAAIHVVIAGIGVEDCDFELPQAIGLHGLDHTNLDLVREGGEGCYEGYQEGDKGFHLGLR